MIDYLYWCSLLLNFSLFIFAFLFGAVAGFAELLSRYKSASLILKNRYGLCYLGINGVGSVLGLWLIEEFNILGSLSDNITFKLLFAGMSSMIILRSSFISVKINNETSDIGLSALLQVFLNSAESSFDQHKSQTELPKVKDIMKHVDFDKAKIALPDTCYKLMKTFTYNTWREVGLEVSNIEKNISEREMQSIHLGLALYEITGLDFLKQAVETLGESIKLNEVDIRDKIKDPIAKELDELLTKLKSES